MRALTAIKTTRTIAGNDKLMKELLKLADAGVFKQFKMNLAEFEKKTREKLSLNRILSLAIAGSADDCDVELVKFCWTASKYQAAYA
jgi:hypothetical protein